MIVAEFIESVRGPLFVLMRRAGRGKQRCVLLVPPFAEEMNKSRRMLCELMRALEAQGIASVLPDLYGTGESAGEFRDAECSVWQDDLVQTAKWAEAQGCSITSMLSVRLGCPLAVEAARHHAFERVSRHVFWQPVIEGQRFLNQFLRLRVAASMMGSAGKETVEGLRTRLRAGETLEVAGYDITSTLAREIDALSLMRMTPAAHEDLHWFEVPADAQSAALPAMQSAVASARAAGAPVQTYSICGQPFWATSEVATVPALVTRSVEVLAPAQRS